MRQDHFKKIAVALVILIAILFALLLTPRAYSEDGARSTVKSRQTDETAACGQLYHTAKKTAENAPKSLVDSNDSEEVEPEWIEYLCTAYCGCEKCVGKWHTEGYTLTASGWGAEEGVTIAADESYPFGTVIYFEGLGERVVMDRGSAITGNRIDVYFESHEDALAFGMKQVRGYLVEVPKE